MSLADRLDDWRDPRHWDVGVPPTDEEVLRQFVYSAITDYIHEHEVALSEWLISSNDDEPPEACEWVDEYADRPLSEPDGYDRAPLP